MRTGDTAANDRQKLIRRPPDLLITTPESLYLMLTSSARDTLAGVDTVIIDEIHAMATTKRGAHLVLSLERLEEVTDRPPQRIGLSATQRPLEEVAHFLGGHADAGSSRPVTIVDAGIRKPLEVEVVIPVEDMGDARPASRSSCTAGRPSAALTERARSIWPSIYPRDPRPGPGASHHDHLLQRPPRGRTAGRQAQRARRRAAAASVDAQGEPASSWSRRTTARSPASSGW